MLPFLQHRGLYDVQTSEEKIHTPPIANTCQNVAEKTILAHVENLHKMSQASFELVQSNKYSDCLSGW